MSNLKLKIFLIVILLVAIVFTVSSNALAVNDNRTEVTDFNVTNNNTSTFNTNTNNNATNNTVSNYNNTTTSLPKTGIDYSMIIIIALFTMSAIYAYTRIRKYRI